MSLIGRISGNPVRPLTHPLFPPSPVFRDQLLKFFEQVPDSDFEALTNALDKAGNTLEYRKYCDPFFEIFITGGLLAPGGSYLDENVPLTKFSIFEAKSSEVEDVRPFVSTLEKLIRREHARWPCLGNLNDY